MPLIKPRTQRIDRVRHSYRLLAPNRDTLVRYAEFIDESLDYVVNQLIGSTLAKDREFVAWLATRPAEGRAPVTADTPTRARRRQADEPL